MFAYAYKANTDEEKLEDMRRAMLDILARTNNPLDIASVQQIRGIAGAALRGKQPDRTVQNIANLSDNLARADRLFVELARDLDRGIPPASIKNKVMDYLDARNLVY